MAAAVRLPLTGARATFGHERCEVHLYETHIPVRDTIVAKQFYREVVGLPFAYRDPTRDIVFLWADVK